MQLTTAELAALNLGSSISIYPPLPSASTPGVRPSYSVGKGFYVTGGQLFDANNRPFRIRGVNRCHYDSNSAGIYKSGANTVRVCTYLTAEGATTYAAVCGGHLTNKQIPILSLFYFPDATATSGSQDVTKFNAAIAWWVANAETFTAMPNLIINLVNEWGPSNSVVWANAYSTAIGQLRAAGYTNTLMIDAGGYGQDAAGLINYAPAVFASDPQRNVIFGFHLYGNTPSVAAMTSYFEQFATLSKQDGMVFVVSEFGPGNNIQPSATLIAPYQVIDAAEANGIGWLGWAWDDNNLANGASNSTSFSMTLAGPGIYTQASDLTPYGVDVVAQLANRASPASIFT